MHFVRGKCVSMRTLVFCTSNIQDQISFIRASIMRKSYHEVSMKLGIRIEEEGRGWFIDRFFLFLSKKRKSIFTIFYLLELIFSSSDIQNFCPRGRKE